MDNFTKVATRKIIKGIMSNPIIQIIIKGEYQTETKNGGTLTDPIIINSKDINPMIIKTLNLITPTKVDIIQTEMIEEISP
jgi:hypothetical protein